MIAYRTRGLVRLYAVATVAVVGAWFLGYAAVLRSRYGETSAAELPSELCFLCVVGGMLGGAHLVTRLGARVGRLTWQGAVTLATRQIALVAAILLFALATRGELAAGWPFAAVFLGQAWLLLIVLGAVLPRCLARIAFNRTRHIPTLFIGRVRSVQLLREWAADKMGIGIRPVGFLSDEAAELAASVPTPYLGRIDRLGALLQAEIAAQVVVVDPPLSAGAFHELVDICQREGCRLLIYSAPAEQLAMPLRPIVEGQHVFHAAHETPLEDPLNRLAKRIVDIGIALTVVTLILAPLSLGVWLMQCSQAPGPLLVTRPREGRNRTAFALLKYRSSREVSAASGDESSPANQRGCGRFPFGWFLRKTGLNKLPQFVNVLLGHMSVVGPRPHRARPGAEVARMDRDYRTRTLVRPGITGLAQVHRFRGERPDHESLHERAELDIRYIRSWSLRLDLEIILRSVWQIRPDRHPKRRIATTVLGPERTDHVLQ